MIQIRKPTRPAWTALILALMAGACAAPAPRPETLRLSADQIRIGFSDGRVCRAPLAAQGHIADCPVPVDYRVTGLRQNWLRPVLGDLVEPFADVTVIAAGNRYVFRTPQSRNWQASGDNED